ncbi:hypothetical protein Bca4012_050483 [Brassica carinata]|uniref:Uncharacterized protein n=1 Tax=Brassica carinata TaxID=52824 RepID=A0A8X7UKN6_BRACI|nr:hypothetical protein Bca52824_053189 [Brassica carinata]
MNLDRSITKSPEELTSIWYDYHLGRWHIRITMKASHFIVCWSNKQPSAVTLLFHGGEEMVTLQCLLKDGSSGVFFCIHYGTDALSETDATSTKHSLRNTLFHFTCGKSQQPSTQHPYQSVREPCIDTVSASDASVFGSQWTEDGNDDAETSKRRKLDDGSAQSSTFVPGSHGEDEARPVGLKASKAKEKRLEKLNKQKLLDSLIAKTEPLSELEIALKNKLINDMLAI